MGALARQRTQPLVTPDELTRRPVTLREMWEAADSEAARIEQSENAWAIVRDPQRPAPLPGQLRRAQVFRAMVRMIERIDADQTIKDRLKAGAGK